MDDRYSIIVSPSCGFCSRAVDLLIESQVNFEMFTYEHDSRQLSEAKEKYNWPTVPIIWKGEQFIGGFTDLQRLLEDGKTEEEKNQQEE